MTDRYEMAQAVRDLRRAGLLRAVVVAEAGSWRERDDAPADAAFHGAVLDSREVRPGVLFVGLPGTRTDGRRFAAGALAAGAQALVGPGPDGVDPPGEPAPGAGTVLVSDDPEAALAHLASCWRARFSLPVVGITGSNGKTTTKDFTAALLGTAGEVLATQGNLNSAQGVPVTVLGLAACHRFAVIEMGASAVGHIAARAAVARPRVGVITNAAGAHLEEFGSLEQVIEGKGELVAGLPADGVAVLNADSPGFEAWCERALCRVVSWGRERGDHRWSWQPGDAEAAGWLSLDGRRWPVPLPGAHNGANLCAAILAARAVGQEDAQLAAGLGAFRASAHRGDLRRLGGRLVLDDSYNANPESVCTAVRALLDLPGGEALAVLGFMAELGPRSEALHRDCGRDCAALGLRRLLVVGESARALAEGFREGGGEARVVPDHATAAAAVVADTAVGDRILVKGSRSAGMERVLVALREDHDWREETPR
jgi:UDP-N-acetylmuramoyl-tripeptide--D-alanyl-D-alanine ligase